MKSIVLKSIVLIFVVFLQTSCLSDEGNQCYYEFISFATNVTAPTISNVNEEMTFTVTHLPQYGCSTFLRFNQSTNENINNINLLVKTEECNCTTNPVPTNVIYKFTPTTPGEYTFRFKSGADSVIIKNVTVQ